MKPPKLIVLVPLALLAAIAAGFFFHTTLFPYVYPGESAHAITGHTNLKPFNPIKNQLWGMIAREIAPQSETWKTLNMFSAFCGAACVLFTFLITASIPRNRSTEESLDIEFQPAWIPAFSGFAAAGLLAINANFWFASTRAYPETLGLAMLLGCVWLVVHHMRIGKLWPLVIAAPIWGIGLTEYVTFLFMLPLFVLACINGMYLRFDRFRFWPLVGIGILGLAGCTFALVGAQTIMAHPSAEWMFIDSIQDALKSMVTLQFNTLKNTVPQLGWLALGLSCFLPGLIVLLPKRVSQFSMIWTSVLLHFLCTIVVGLILYNSFISPWQLFGTYPLFITPAVFVAIWGGYLAGYWVIVLRRRKRASSGFEKGLRKLMAFLILPGTAAAIGIAGWLNFGTIGVGKHENYQAIINHLADDAEQYQMVLTETGLKEAMRVELHTRGKQPILLNARQGGADSYRRYLMTIFPDPRLRALAQVSQNAVLTNWLKDEKTIAGQFATLGHADLLRNAGLTPEPSGTLFVGANPPTPPAEAFARQQAIWKTFDVEALKKSADDGSPLSGYSKWFLVHQSKLANNLGVIMHEAGNTTSAASAYRKSLSFHDDNLSALLNLANLYPDPEQAGGTNYLAMVQERLDERQKNSPHWALSYYYGYVHDPGFYLKRGMAWAMSGKPKVAAREMELAMRMDRDNQSLRRQLAAVYFQSGDSRKSAAAYSQILRDDPNDVRAILALARIAALETEIDTARTLLDRLRRLNVTDEQIAIEEAGISLLLGDEDRAMSLFERVVDKDPENVQAWSGIAILAHRSGDEDYIQRSMSILDNRSDLPPEYSKLLGYLHTVQGDYTDARLAFNKALRKMPKDPVILEQLLRLDMRESRPRATTSQRVKALLENDPTNAYANYVMGLLQHMNNQNDLAASSFKMSLKTERSRDTLNALAWALYKLSDYEEARPFAEECVRMDPSYAASWDTLGNIYHKLGDTPRGAKCLEKALQAAPNHPMYMYHLALMFENMEREEEALELVKGLKPNLVYMPTELHRDILDLEDRLEAFAAGSDPLLPQPGS